MKPSVDVKNIRASMDEVNNLFKYQLYSANIDYNFAKTICCGAAALPLSINGIFTIVVDRDISIRIDMHSYMWMLYHIEAHTDIIVESDSNLLRSYLHGIANEIKCDWRASGRVPSGTGLTALLAIRAFTKQRGCPMYSTSFLLRMLAIMVHELYFKLTFKG